MMTDPQCEQRLTVRRRRIAGCVIAVILVAFVWAVCFFIGRPMIRFVSEPEKFRAWVAARGWLGKFAFVGMTLLQIVIAVIPGEPLEIGAGYAFGAVWGTALCVLGNLIGGAVVLALVRGFGIRFVELFFPREKLLSLRFLQNTKRLNTVVFLLFLIPGTPKDLLSYFVGLTEMKWSTWLLITTAARLPSIVTSTVGGSALGRESYGTAVIVFAVTAAVSAAGYFVYLAICKKFGKNKDNT